MIGSAAAQLLAELRRQDLALATAESLTGGLVASAITAVPGASLSFRGGVVAYATDVKASLLGVPTAVLDEHGPVSAQTAGAMALGVADLLVADIGLATTGVAGPDPVGEHPPGLAFIAAARRTGGVQVRRLQLAGDRGQVRTKCASAVLRLGLAVLRAGNGRS